MHIASNSLRHTKWIFVANPSPNYFWVRQLWSDARIWPRWVMSLSQVNAYKKGISLIVLVPCEGWRYGVLPRIPSWNITEDIRTNTPCVGSVLRILIHLWIDYFEPIFLLVLFARGLSKTRSFLRSDYEQVIRKPFLAIQKVVIMN